MRWGRSLAVVLLLAAISAAVRLPLAASGVPAYSTHELLGAGMPGVDRTSALPHKLPGLPDVADPLPVLRARLLARQRRARLAGETAVEHPPRAEEAGQARLSLGAQGLNHSDVDSPAVRPQRQHKPEERAEDFITRVRKEAAARLPKPKPASPLPIAREVTEETMRSAARMAAQVDATVRQRVASEELRWIERTEAKKSAEKEVADMFSALKRKDRPRKPPPPPPLPSPAHRNLSDVSPDCIKKRVDWWMCILRRPPGPPPRDRPHGWKWPHKRPALRGRAKRKRPPTELMHWEDKDERNLLPGSVGLDFGSNVMRTSHDLRRYLPPGSYVRVLDRAYLVAGAQDDVTITLRDAYMGSSGNGFKAFKAKPPASPAEMRKKAADMERKVNALLKKQQAEEEKEKRGSEGGEEEDS
eukprot:PLAT7718.1.p1 GENE.PLAT7718.1~~PLAT7718.1.p1  ORF type:complete len:415 (-),score=122.72 PLAT7718.1:38-1282(-)